MYQHFLNSQSECRRIFYTTILSNSKRLLLKMQLQNMNYENHLISMRKWDRTKIKFSKCSAQKTKFSIKDFSSIWPNPQLFADLVTFTEEILNQKLIFCAVEWPWKFNSISKTHTVFLNLEFFFKSLTNVFQIHKFFKTHDWYFSNWQIFFKFPIDIFQMYRKTFHVKRIFSNQRMFSKLKYTLTRWKIHSRTRYFWSGR